MHELPFGREMRFVKLLVPALVAVALSVGTAAAIVPPTNCGMQTVSGHRYQIKADQMRCRTAKRYSRTYLSTGRRPSGYRCRNFRASDTKLKFRCSKGIRVFFAIRR
jgi:hypothetical protein